MKIQSGMRRAGAWMLAAALLVPAGAAMAAPHEGAPKGATRFLASDNLLKTWFDGGVGLLAEWLQRFGLGPAEVPGKAGIHIDPDGAGIDIDPNGGPAVLNSDGAGIDIDPFG